MKILKFLVLPTLMMMMLFSCKKDNSQNSVSDEEVVTTKKGVSISNSGFLVFNTTEDILRFGKLLIVDKDDKLINELKNNGFKSRKANQTELARNPNSIYNQFFDAQGLLQVNNVIMKITDDDRFIFTMLQQYADATAMTNLINEVFDPSKMNKINIDRELEAEFNMVAFANQNPAGLIETVNTSGLRRRMFGTSDSPTVSGVPYGSSYNNPSGNGCLQMTCEVTHHTQYLFWIVIDTWDTEDNCFPVSVSGPCN